MDIENINIGAPRDFSPRVSGGSLSLSNRYQLGEHHDSESIQNVNTITHNTLILLIRTEGFHSSKHSQHRFGRFSAEKFHFG